MTLTLHTRDSMKALLYLVFLTASLGLWADHCDNIYCYTGWTLEVRGAYYQPQSRKMRHMYSGSWLDYQVEASKRVNKHLEVWTGVYWASKQHGSVHPYIYDYYQFKDQTKIFVLPVSLGIKFVYPLCSCIDMYVGAGACYSFLRIHNHCYEHYSDWGLSSSPFKREIKKSAAGGIFKLGARYALGSSTFLDIFIDYYAQRFKFSHHDYSDGELFKNYANCSGFKFGAGLGVYF